MEIIPRPKKGGSLKFASETFFFAAKTSWNPVLGCRVCFLIQLHKSPGEDEALLSVERQQTVLCNSMNVIKSRVLELRPVFYSKFPTAEIVKAVIKLYQEICGSNFVK